MTVLTISANRHRKLAHFRHNIWKAIALCMALRLADSAFGVGILETASSIAAEQTAYCAIHQDMNL